MSRATVHLTVNISPEERAMLAALTTEHGATVTDVVRAMIRETWEQYHAGQSPPPWEPNAEKSRAGRTPKRPKANELAGAMLTLKVDGSDPRVIELLKAIGGTR